MQSNSVATFHTLQQALRLVLPNDPFDLGTSNRVWEYLQVLC
jgi:hypothetical protein